MICRPEEMFDAVCIRRVYDQRMLQIHRRAHWVVLFTQIALASCGSYTIQGRVVEGANAMITFVPANDPSLEFGRPVSNAVVALVRDPDQLNRETVAQARSGQTGWFAMPVGAFGAGWMDEMWDVEVRAPGYHAVQNRLRLAGEDSGMVMLIIVAPGVDVDTGDENLLEEIDRFR